MPPPNPDKPEEKTLTTKVTKGHDKVDPDFIYGMAQLAYTECNLCRRCVHYCPIGIDTGYIMTVMRRICHKIGRASCRERV